MGVAPSSVFYHSERQRKSVTKLQQTILEYLWSDDYFTDPYQHFEDISALGYPTLEAFISSIPPNDTTDQILYQQVIRPVTQLGMRYVVLNEPGKRGTLATPICVLPKENLATLRMDQEDLPSTSVNSISWLFLFPFRYVFKIFGSHTIAKKELYCVYPLDQLIPEKEHLKAYLTPLPFDLPQNPAFFHPLAQNENLLAPAKSEANYEYTADMTVDNVAHVPLLHFSEKVLSERESPIGPRKGIEGAHNSCYLDSLLVAMFYCTNMFDFLTMKKSTDNKYARKARRLLLKIVKSLRENYYCDYETVWSLREYLSTKNEDLLGAFMDAEQVLYLLCEDVLMESHFIQYAGVDDDGWGDFMHLMSIDPSDTSKIITVQRNMEASFAFNGNIKFASVPNPALVLGMPRSNRELIHYEGVIPNLEIWIEDLMNCAACQFCGQHSTWEIQQEDINDGIIPICDTCLNAKIDDFSSVKIVSRTRMQLNSVVCIRGVHFVAFIRSNSSNSNKTGNIWYFFDSMAGGYPEVKEVPKLEEWLNILVNEPDKFYTSKIPSLVKRTITDGHLCIYEPVYFEI